MLHANDTGFVSGSAEALAKMMTNYFRGSVRRIWTDGVGDEDSDSLDMGTGEKAEEGSANSTSSGTTGDRSSRT